MSELFGGEFDVQALGLALLVLAEHLSSHCVIQSCAWMSRRMGAGMPRVASSSRLAVPVFIMAR